MLAFFLLTILILVVVTFGAHTEDSAPLYFDMDMQVDGKWVAGEEGARAEEATAKAVTIRTDSVTKPSNYVPPQESIEESVAPVSTPTSDKVDEKALAQSIYKNIRL